MNIHIAHAQYACYRTLYSAVIADSFVKYREKENKQGSYFHVHTAINILRCFGYPREQNFGLVLILSEPNRLYRRLRLFPSKLQEYTPPPFSRLSTQYHIDPLLVFFLSILHERVCDYSRVQSSVTGILRMGDMNIHMTWLTHVRTGPKKKIALRTSLVPRHQIFRARPAALSKNRVWTLSLRKLGQVYIWRAVNWVIVGVNYIISNQQRLLWRQKFASWLFMMTHNTIYFT